MQFSERLTNSAAFGTLFREGMDLVEETAAYLDGAGRTEAKALDRSVSLTYATESMRLTTRLMQLASWLLLHRAVKEGEMTLTQANREKTKVKLSAADPGPDDMIEKLPQQLQDLIARSMSLQTQGAPPRHHHPHRRQPSAPRSAIRWCRSSTPEGGVRAVSLDRIPVGIAASNKTPRREAGAFFLASLTADGCEPSIFLEEARKLLLEPRDAAAAVEQLLGAADPGRVRLGSMSRFSLSPSLPQVERVWYSVPSVITTVIV